MIMYSYIFFWNMHSIWRNVFGYDRIVKWIFFSWFLPKNIYLIINDYLDMYVLWYFLCNICRKKHEAKSVFQIHTKYLRKSFRCFAFCFPYFSLKTSTIKLSWRLTLKSWQKCIHCFQEDKIERKVFKKMAIFPYVM